MEIAQPSIQQAVARCAAAGARRVVVAPYFLSRGRHIQASAPAAAACVFRASCEWMGVFAGAWGGARGRPPPTHSLHPPNPP